MGRSVYYGKRRTATVFTVVPLSRITSGNSGFTLDEIFAISPAVETLDVIDVDGTWLEVQGRQRRDIVRGRSAE